MLTFFNGKFRKSKVICIAAVLLILAASKSFSQKPTLIKHDTVFIVKQNKEDYETITYKLLYDSTKEANNTLHSVLWSSLALFGTALAVIFGSQVYFNLRLNKKDLDGLRDFFTLKIDSGLQVVDAKIDKVQSEQIAGDKQLSDDIIGVKANVHGLMAESDYNSGSIESSFIYHCLSCYNSSQGGMEHFLVVGFNNLRKFLGRIDSISEDSSHSFDLVKKSVNQKYPNKYSETIKEIEELISQKIISKTSETDTAK